MEGWSQAVVKPGGWTLSMVFFFPVFFYAFKIKHEKRTNKQKKCEKVPTKRMRKKNMLHLSSVLDVFFSTFKKIVGCSAFFQGKVSGGSNFWAASDS